MTTYIAQWVKTHIAYSILILAGLIFFGVFSFITVNEVLSSRETNSQAKVENYEDLTDSKLNNDSNIGLQNSQGEVAGEVAPTQSNSSSSLVTCSVGGEVYKVSKADCEFAEKIMNQTEEYSKQARDSYKPVTLDYELTPLPSFAPIVGTPAEAACNTATQATYKSEYDNLVAKENAEFNQLMAYINNDQNFDNSGTQVIAHTNATNSHKQKLSSLKESYDAKLKSIGCY